MTAEIKNAPARIYLNLGPVPSEEIEFSALHDVTWCADKQDVSDIEYVLAHSDAAQAPSNEPTPLDDETVSVIRSFVDRPGETYRGVITNRLGIGFGRALRRAIEESRAAPVAPAAAPITVLAADHRGMRVDYSGMLGGAQRAMTRGYQETGIAEMLRQFKEHLAELGKRWYAGDTSVVDELLQLYCIEKDARDALVAAQGAAQ